MEPHISDTLPCTDRIALLKSPVLSNPVDNMVLVRGLFRTKAWCSWELVLNTKSIPYSKARGELSPSEIPLVVTYYARSPLSLETKLRMVREHGHQYRNRPNELILYCTGTVTINIRLNSWYSLITGRFKHVRNHSPFEYERICFIQRQDAFLDAAWPTRRILKRHG